MALFNELKRRKVFRVTSLYAVTAWGASMGAAELFPTFGLPDESVRWFVIASLGLLPIVALLAWLYELTPGGIERDPADRDLSKTSDSTTRIAPQRKPVELVVTWRGRRWTFQNTFIIGRDDSCELLLNDPKISRRHVRVIAKKGTWYVEDLGSSNGTSVNGELISRIELPAKAFILLYDGADAIQLEASTSSGVTTVLAGPPKIT